MPHPAVLDFERPIVALERKIEELRAVSECASDRASEVARLERKVEQLRARVFGRLTPWQRVQLARHPARPRPAALVPALVDELIELHGDRVAGDDPAVIAGLGFLERRAVAVLAHGDGRRPAEGRDPLGRGSPVALRKARRLVALAERFSLPLLLLVDAAEGGADIGVEDVAVGPALAELLAGLARLPSPSVALVTGEAYGAVDTAFTVADRVLVLEHAVCAPLSPERCAALELGKPARVAEAAAALRLTSADLLATGFCHAVVSEPPGGAHRDPEACAELLRSAIRRELTQLDDCDAPARLSARMARLETLGQLVAVGG